MARKRKREELVENWQQTDPSNAISVSTETLDQIFAALTASTLVQQPLIEGISTLLGLDHC